jgi:hypothetical protein
MAATDQERVAIAGELDQTLERGVKQGLTTQKSAEAYRQSLRSTGDNAVAYRDVARDPNGTLKRLEDPAYAAGLAPQAREQLKVQARAAADDLKVQSETNRARLNPEIAPFIAGRITDMSHAGQVFERIIAQESGGRPGVVSAQGALGLTQLMLPTAREMATKQGVALPGNDEEARAFLLANPEVNKRLGFAYFQQNLKQFNGALAPAIAAYHAGTNSKPVMEAHRKAIELHGENYSPAQFSALLPDWLADKDKNGNPAKKTKDYVLDIYKRMGVEPTGAGVSQQASWRVVQSVSGVMQQQEAQRNQTMNQLVASAGRDADAIRPVLNEGLDVDPQRLALVRAPLLMAAQRGNADAAEKLISLDEAVEMRPHIKQAWGMRSEVLMGEVAAMRAQMAQAVVSPEQLRRVKVFEAVATAQAEMRNSDNIGLAYRQGLAQPETIPAQVEINSPDFRAALARRSVVSDRGHQMNGGTQMFFQPEERRAWKARWNEMGDTDKGDLIKSIADATTSEKSYATAIKEVTGGDALAETAGKFMRSKPDLARDIIRGSALLEHPSVKPKVEDTRKALIGQLGGDMFPANVQKDLIDASLAIYAADRGKNGSLYDASDAAGIEKALERVIGKTVKRNGKRLPLPDGVPERSFSEAMDGLLPTTLENFGGAKGRNGETLDAGFVGRNARLTPMGVGDGRYLVSMPGAKQDAPVLTKAGQPLIIDINEVVRLQRVSTGATVRARANSRFYDQAMEERQNLGIGSVQGPNE